MSRFHLGMQITAQGTLNLWKFAPTELQAKVSNSTNVSYSLL